MRDSKQSETQSNGKTRIGIVLDLDETLVFTTMIQPKKKDALEIKVGRRKIYVQMRKGLRQFLREVSKIFEVFFFTASTREYAQQIINHIMPETPNDHRFFDDDCVKMFGYPVKDLKTIKYDLDKLILIDDTEASAHFQPKNLIKISPWLGCETDTVLLDQLLPALKSLNHDGKIPSILDEIFNSNFYPSLSRYHPYLL